LKAKGVCLSRRQYEALTLLVEEGRYSTLSEAMRRAVDLLIERDPPPPIPLLVRLWVLERAVKARGGQLSLRPCEFVGWAESNGYRVEGRPGVYRYVKKALEGMGFRRVSSRNGYVVEVSKL